MKKSFLVFTFLCTTIVLNAQTGKTGTGTSKSAKTVATKTTAAKPAVNALKNMNDSASYAVGVSVANFYKQQGIKNLNTSLVSKAINDIYPGKSHYLMMPLPIIV